MKIACWRRLSWLTLMESLKMWWFILRVWCFRLWMLDAAAEPEQSHWVVKQKGKNEEDDKEKAERGMFPLWQQAELFHHLIFLFFYSGADCWSAPEERNSGYRFEMEVATRIDGIQCNSLPLNSGIEQRAPPLGTYFVLRKAGILAADWRFACPLQMTFPMMYKINKKKRGRIRRRKRMILICGDNRVWIDDGNVTNHHGNRKKTEGFAFSE